MNDGSFNGMSAVRHTAQRIVSEVLVDRFKLNPEQCMLIENQLADIIEQQADDIFDMKRHEYDLEDVDNFMRGVLCLGDEEYDENGKRILLDENMLNRLIEETGYVFDAELGTWDNIENAYRSLLRKDKEFKDYCDSLDRSDEE